MGGSLESRRVGRVYGADVYPKHVGLRIHQ